jgi:hypothetical protein
MLTPVFFQAIFFQVFHTRRKQDNFQDIKDYYQSPNPAEPDAGMLGCWDA